ncbi:MAG: hypothetical protein ACPHQP_01730 [Longimicrobiales bacterium]
MNQMSGQNHRRLRATLSISGALAVLLIATACDDDPFAFRWTDNPDTVLLYSMARPELGLVSAYSFYQGLELEVEVPSSAGQWDLAIDTQGGEIVMLPPPVLGIFTEAEIATIENTRLEDVTQAPSDSLRYVSDRPVPVEFGNVYVVKTNRSPGSFGRSCRYHAKLEAVDIDPVGGTFVFRHVTNPVCNDRDLVPPN